MSGKQAKKLRKITRKLAGEAITNKVDSDFGLALKSLQKANSILKRKQKIRDGIIISMSILLVAMIGTAICLYFTEYIKIVAQ